MKFSTSSDEKRTYPYCVLCKAVHAKIQRPLVLILARPSILWLIYIFRKMISAAISEKCSIHWGGQNIFLKVWSFVFSFNKSYLECKHITTYYRISLLHLCPIFICSFLCICIVFSIWSISNAYLLSTNIRNESQQPAIKIKVLVKWYAPFKRESPLIHSFLGE